MCLVAAVWNVDILRASNDFRYTRMFMRLRCVRITSQQSDLCANDLQHICWAIVYRLRILGKPNALNGDWFRSSMDCYIGMAVELAGNKRFTVILLVTLVESRESIFLELRSKNRMSCLGVTIKLNGDGKVLPNSK